MKKFFATIIIAIVAIVSLNAQNVSLRRARMSEPTGIEEIDALPTSTVVVSTFNLSDRDFKLDFVSTDGVEYHLYLVLDKNFDYADYDYYDAIDAVFSIHNNTTYDASHVDVTNATVIATELTTFVRLTVAHNDGTGYRYSNVELIFQ